MIDTIAFIVPVLGISLILSALITGVIHFMGHDEEDEDE